MSSRFELKQVGCRSPSATIGPSLRAADEPQNVLTPTSSAFDVMSRFAKVLETMQKHYVDPKRIPSADTTVALREFVRSIDPEADILTAEEAAITNALGDTGLSLALRNDYPTVVAPLRNNCSASPLGHSPRCSYQSSSSAVDRS